MRMIIDVKLVEHDCPFRKANQYLGLDEDFSKGSISQYMDGMSLKIGS